MVRKKLDFLCAIEFLEIVLGSKNTDHYTQLIDLFRVLEINSVKWKR